jgi:hypothetical protein
MNFGEETWLTWEPSLDDLTPPSIIRYEVFLNGVFEHATIGRTETVLYGRSGLINVFEVVAVDEAGNRSVPASFTIDMR